VANYDPLDPNMVARFHGDPLVLHAKIDVVPDLPSLPAAAAGA